MHSNEFNYERFPELVSVQKCDILFKVKACEDFNRRRHEVSALGVNMLQYFESRQRRDEHNAEIGQNSHLWMDTSQSDHICNNRYAACAIASGSSFILLINARSFLLLSDILFSTSSLSRPIRIL